MEPEEEAAAPAAKRRSTDGRAEEVACLHILQKHTGSRNPKTWKGDTVSRDKVAAEENLLALKKQIDREIFFKMLFQTDAKTGKTPLGLLRFETIFLKLLRCIVWVFYPSTTAKV